MFAAVPAVEIADDLDASGVGCPDGKVDAGNAVNGADLRTKSFVQLVMATFADQVAIKVGQDRWSGVRVLHVDHFAGFVGHLDAVSRFCGL